MIFAVEDFQVLFQPLRLSIQLRGSSFHFHIFIRSSKYDLFNINYYFNSCHFHHGVYYELTMACSPVGLI